MTAGHPPTSLEPPHAGWLIYVDQLRRASRGKRRWMWHQLRRAQQIELLRMWYLSGLDPFELNAGKLKAARRTWGEWIPEKCIPLEYRTSGT